MFRTVNWFVEIIFTYERMHLKLFPQLLKYLSADLIFCLVMNSADVKANGLCVWWARILNPSKQMFRFVRHPLPFTVSLRFETPGCCVKNRWWWLYCASLVVTCQLSRRLGRSRYWDAKVNGRVGTWVGRSAADAERDGETQWREQDSWWKHSRHGGGSFCPRGRGEEPGRVGAALPRGWVVAEEPKSCHSKWTFENVVFGYLWCDKSLVV